MNLLNPIVRQRLSLARQANFSTSYMKRNSVVVIFVVFLLTSCGLLPTPITASTRIPSLLTATTVITNKYQRMCLDIEKNSIGTTRFRGKIVLSHRETNTTYDKIYTLSADGSLSVLIEKAYGDVIISPDGKQLAYHTLGDNQSDQSTKSFKIISLNRELEDEIPYGTTQYDLQGWLDNKRIMLYSYTKNLLVLDIFTRQIDEIDITSPAYGIGTNGFGFQSVNSTLDRMLYYRSLPVSEFPSAVLWDLENNKEIWRLDIGAELLWRTLSQWSPDGSHFVIAGPVTIYDPVLELFLVDRDGNVKQLTHLQGAGLEHGMIEHPTWSPDGRYIAFWLENSLNIFDTTTERVIDYCIFTNPPGAPSSPLNWSPDNAQIVLHGSENPSGPKPVIIVDVKENKAIEVFGSEYSVEGWMIENP